LTFRGIYDTLSTQKVNTDFKSDEKKSKQLDTAQRAPRWWEWGAEGIVEHGLGAA
jgi:hypothetical protein